MKSSALSTRVVELFAIPIGFISLASIWHLQNKKLALKDKDSEISNIDEIVDDISQIQPHGVPFLFKSLEAACYVLRISLLKNESVTNIVKRSLFESLDALLKEDLSSKRQHKAKYIVLEGLHGSGTTALSTWIDQHTSSQVKICVLPEKFQNFKKSIKDCNLGIKLTFDFICDYAIALEALHSTSEYVVIDRFLHTSIVDTIFAMNSVDQANPSAFKWPGDIFQPDLVVYLAMDTQTRLGRTHAPPQSPLSLVTSDCKTSHSHAYARSAHHRAEEGNTTCQPTTSTTSAAFQRAVAEDYAVQSAYSTVSGPLVVALDATTDLPEVFRVFCMCCEQYNLPISQYSRASERDSMVPALHEPSGSEEDVYNSNLLLMYNKRSGGSSNDEEDAYAYESATRGIDTSTISTAEDWHVSGHGGRRTRANGEDDEDTLDTLGDSSRVNSSRGSGRSSTSSKHSSSRLTRGKSERHSKRESMGVYGAMANIAWD